MTGAAPLAPVVGFQGKLYYNSATYASPTWVLIPNVGDIKMTDEADEGELPLRAGGGFMLYVSGLRKIGWEWSSMHDNADTQIAAIGTAYAARSIMEFLILDGSSTNTGSAGFRVSCMITKFPRQEELSKPMMRDIGIKPTYAISSGTIVVPSPYTAT